MQFSRVIFLLVYFLGATVNAGPYFSNKEGDLVWDQATELVWMRCSLGQKWSESEKCVGLAKDYSLDEAVAIVGEINKKEKGSSRWSIPDIYQLASLRMCFDNGFYGLTEGLDRDIEKECVDGSLYPVIDPVAFPGTEDEKYWSNTNYIPRGGISPAFALGSVAGMGSAWYVNFFSGAVFLYSKNNKSFLRLVRLNKIPADSARATFYNLLPDPDKKAWNDMVVQREKKEWQRKNTAIADAEAKVTARVAAEKAEKLAAEKEKVRMLRVAIAKGARQLYLLAGQVQRGKDVQIEGRIYSATELYDLVVDNYPDSEFAVKATDQLTAISRNESLSRAASEGQSRAQQQMENQRAATRQQCEAQKQTCFSGCGQSSYWNGRSYVDNQSWSGCRSRCESISCY